MVHRTKSTTPIFQTLLDKIYFILHNVVTFKWTTLKES